MLQKNYYASEQKLTLQSTFTYCGDLQVAFFRAYLVSSSQHVDIDFVLYWHVFV